MSAHVALYLTGDAENVDPLASLGGARSLTQAPAALWSDVPEADCLLGYVDYRCVDLANTGDRTAHAVDVWTDPAGGVALGVPRGQGVQTKSPLEAPADWYRPWVEFAGYSAVSPLTLALLGPGQALRLWLRRTTPAGSPGADVTSRLCWRYV